MIKPHSRDTKSGRRPTLKSTARMQDIPEPIAPDVRPFWKTDQGLNPPLKRVSCMMAISCHWRPGKGGSRVGSAEDALVERYGATDCFGQLGEGPRWSAVLKHDRLQRVELGGLTSANCRHSRVPSSFLHSSHSRERKPNPNDDGLWIERLRQGNLFPFALNASPNDVSLPPPVALSWHSPQALPVWVAN